MRPRIGVASTVKLELPYLPPGGRYMPRVAVLTDRTGKRSFQPLADDHRAWKGKRIQFWRASYDLDGWTLLEPIGGRR